MVMPSFPTAQQQAAEEFLPAYAFQQQRQQTGLANQFAQQELLQKKADYEAQMLKNLFDQQNNPQKIKNQELINQGLETTNQKTSAEFEEYRSPAAVEARRSKFVAEADENKLKQLMSRAERDMFSDDPKIAAAAKDMYMRSAKEISARAKHADEMEKTKAEVAGREKVANIHAGATLGAARIGADSRQAIQGMKSQVGDVLAKLVGKPPGAQYASLTAWAQQAAQMGDMEKAQLYGSMAESIRPQVEASLNARPDPNAVSATGATGMPGQAPVQLPPNKFARPQQPAPQPNPATPQGGRVSVISPDGKVGSIPADQLQQALKAGYKQR